MRIGLSLKLPEPKYNVLAQNVQALFADGSQGWFYDNQDPSTLFQDSAGTTPVTAVEQSVGLQLDKSKGLVLGPELVVNGDGTSLTGWSQPQGNWWTISSGRFYHASNSNYRGLEQSLGLVAGKFYKLTFDLQLVAGQLQVNTRDTIGGGAIGIYNFNSSGSHSIIIAGANPVIAFGRGLGLTTEMYIDNISVRELPGNHRYQTTSGSRPVWSKRVNRLTKTEQFDDAAWTKTNATITANATTAPDGTLTADKVVSGASTSATGVSQSVSIQISQISQSWSVKQSEVRYVQLLWIGTASTEYANFDLQTGTVTQTNALIAPNINAENNGFYRIRLTSASAATSVTAFCWAISSGTAGRGATYPGNGSDGFFIWAADLRAANQATGLLPLYQRVNTATDYDTNGFPGYLKADGTDDFLQTNSIDFTATDKVTLCAGVRKLSDAAIQMLYELSANLNANNGTFNSAPGYSGVGSGVGAYWNAVSKGTTLAAAVTTATFPAPQTAVQTHIGEISTDTSLLRINGTQVASSSADQGTGNYGNYPVYFFRRGGASLPFNGEEYANIAVGKLLTADQLTALETYVNGATRAY